MSDQEIIELLKALKKDYTPETDPIYYGPIQ